MIRAKTNRVTVPSAETSLSQKSWTMTSQSNITNLRVNASQKIMKKMISVEIMNNKNKKVTKN